MNRFLPGALSLSPSDSPQCKRQRQGERRQSWRGGRRSSDYEDVLPKGRPSVGGIGRYTWVLEEDVLELLSIN